MYNQVASCLNVNDAIRIHILVAAVNEAILDENWYFNFSGLLTGVDVKCLDSVTESQNSFYFLVSHLPFGLVPHQDLAILMIEDFGVRDAVGTD